MPSTKEPCSPKLRSCVDGLIAGGTPEDLAWAICRSAIGESKMANLCGTCNWIVDDPSEIVTICPSCGARAYYVPILHAERFRQHLNESMHTRKMESQRRSPDFEYIYGEFIKYYCKSDKSCPLGEEEYYAWVKALGLDETQAYGARFEAFAWSRDLIQRLNEDAENVYYDVLVGFPTKSMNNTTYREKDLDLYAKTIIGVPVNMNHKPEYTFLDSKGKPTITYTAAKFADGANHAILKVPKTELCPVCGGNKPVYQLIDEKKIYNISLEGGCIATSGDGVCHGFKYSGCALLTTDVLPGIPMCKISPLESVVSEALKSTRKPNVKIIKAVVKLTEKSGDLATDKTGTDLSTTSGNQCPEGQIMNDMTGECEPIKTPQDSLDLTNEKIARLKAEDSKKDADERALAWEKRYAESDKQLQQSLGRITQLEVDNKKLGTSVDQMNLTKTEDATQIHELGDRIRDVTVARDGLQVALEKAQKRIEELSTKYETAQKTNLALSRDLTQTKEETLKLLKVRETLQENLRKVERLSRKIIKLRV